MLICTTFFFSEKAEKNGEKEASESEHSGNVWIVS